MTPETIHIQTQRLPDAVGGPLIAETHWATVDGRYVCVGLRLGSFAYESFDKEFRTAQASPAGDALTEVRPARLREVPWSAFIESIRIGYTDAHLSLSLNEQEVAEVAGRLTDPAAANSDQWIDALTDDERARVFGEPASMPTPPPREASRRGGRRKIVMDEKWLERKKVYEAARAAGEFGNEALSRHFKEPLAVTRGWSATLRRHFPELRSPSRPNTPVSGPDTERDDG